MSDFVLLRDLKIVLALIPDFIFLPVLKSFLCGVSVLDTMLQAVCYCC